LVIAQDLVYRGPCTLEELVRRLPSYTWNQVFATVDTLTREGRLTLRPHQRFGYAVSLTVPPKAA
jgi:hypothetical protein